MASINDVAKLAHVSKSTVSLVINGTGYVSEETRQKVQAAIDELNYTPSRLAQGLSTNHSGLIAVVVPDLLHPYFSAVVKSIEQTLAKHEYMTIVCSAKENEQTERWYVEMLNRKIVDGIITAGHTIDLSAYKSSSRPIVSIDRYINDSIPIVQADHRQAAKLAVELLIEAGCQSVVHFTGTPNIDVQSHAFNEMLESELRRNHIQNFSYYIGHNTFRPEEYIHAAQQLFASGKEFDCIVGVDSSILACHREAVDRGIRVPEDLKLIAYDGTYITKLHTPVVTSVVQPIAEIGQAAAELIVDQIQGKKAEPLRRILSVRVQKGETC